MALLTMPIKLKFLESSRKIHERILQILAAIQFIEAEELVKIIMFCWKQHSLFVYEI